MRTLRLDWFRLGLIKDVRLRLGVGIRIRTRIKARHSLNVRKRSCWLHHMLHKIELASTFGNVYVEFSQHCRLIIAACKHCLRASCLTEWPPIGS